MVDRQADLERLLELLWESISSVDPDKRAPIAARIESVLQQVASLESAKPKGGDPIDEIAARRTARGGSTSRLGQANRGTV